MKFTSKISTSRDYNKYVKRLQELSSNPMSRVSGIVSLTIFTVAFFGVFAILPTFKTIGSLTKEIEDVEKVNQKLSLKIKALGKAEDVYTQTRDDLLAINKVLPESADFNRLAWQVEWLARDADLLIPSIGFGEFQIVGYEEAEEGLGKIIVETTVVGNYSEIKKFVKKLNEIDRLISIDDVRITNKSLFQGSNELSTNIKFAAYYLPKSAFKL